jgi:uncharacterized OB-fold protein
MSISAPAEPGTAPVPPRPVPVPDERSNGFWEAAARHVLAIQRCADCGWLSYPPDTVCASCLSPTRDFHWQEVSGRGVLRSWTVVHTAFLPGFAPYVPYVVVAVELEEQPGLRVTARLLDGSDPPLAYGAPAHIDFEDVAPGVSIPVFRRGAQ